MYLKSRSAPRTKPPGRNHERVLSQGQRKDILSPGVVRQGQDVGLLQEYPRRHGRYGRSPRSSVSGWPRSSAGSSPRPTSGSRAHSTPLPGIIAAGVTLEYSQALMLPKEKEKALGLSAISLLCTGSRNRPDFAVLPLGPGDHERADEKPWPPGCWPCWSWRRSSADLTMPARHGPSGPRRSE